MRMFLMICMSLITLTALCFLGYFLYETCCSIRRKKSKADDSDFEEIDDESDEVEDDESYVPKLSGNALQKLKSGREACFVEQEILPAVPRMLSFMTMQERHWVNVVLSAFIGVIVVAAPDYEQDFMTVLELLECAQKPEDADEDWQTATDLFMLEDCRKTKSSEAYSGFRKYCCNQQAIILLCIQIIQTICVNLYGYIPLTVSDIPRRMTMKGTDEE